MTEIRVRNQIFGDERDGSWKILSLNNFEVIQEFGSTP